MKLESYILNDFFNILNEIGANYCVMNNYTEMPEVIPTDVDFAIDKETFASLDSLIIYLANKHNVSVTQKIWHGYNKCAYILSPLKTERFFWLQLDFFVDFCAQGFPNLMPVSNMLNNKKQYKNFHVPMPEVEAPFIIQRRIIKGDMKLAHLEILSKLYIQSEKKVSKAIIDTYGVDLGNLLMKTIELKKIDIFNNNFKLFRKSLKQVSNKNSNVKYKFNYYFNQVKRGGYRLFYPTGMSIAIVGNDLEEQKKFINIIESRISGSFHGTKNNSFVTYIKYLKLLWFSIYWSKVTKKTVYVNLSMRDKNWSVFFNSLLVRRLRLCSDVIISYSSNLFDSQDYLNSISYQILKFQSDKTMKHLNSKFSQTSGVKFKNFKK